jgi:hypothetical protein
MISFFPTVTADNNITLKERLGPVGPVICTKKARVAPSSMVSSGVKEKP